MARGRPLNKTRSGLIEGHLMGEYSLARSYWLHTVFFGWGLSAGFAYVVRLIGESHPVRYVSMAIIAYLPVSLALWAWSTFGTTIAAFKSFFNGDARLWSVLALLSLSLGVIGMFHGIPTLKPFMEDHWAVAHGQQPGAPFSVKALNKGRMIEFAGPVNEGAAAALVQAIQASPQATTVRLQSPGGWMQEGERMAQVIQRFRLNTTVATECMSACTIAFLAGLDRTADEAAIVGFHRARAVGNVQSDQGRPDEEELEIYLRAGLDRRFAQRVVSTPNQTIWTPTRRELLQAHVLTR